MGNGHGGRIAVFLALIGAVSCFPAAYGAPAAADAANTSKTAKTALTADTSQQEPTEEVSVEAHKLKLNRLRIEINKAVDNFYDAFNKVNTVPGYETHCSDERRSASYTVHHVCTPRFVNDANEQETQGFFDNYATTPAANLIYLRRRSYEKQLEYLIHTNPQVQQAAAEFDALTQQFAVVSREKVKGS
jgi:hypothetical protein